MLRNKKILFFVSVCFLAAEFAFAQSTVDLTRRFLERADEQYADMQYAEAYKTINATIKLCERDVDGVPANVYLLATQIYTKLLAGMVESRDFGLFDDVMMNLQSYPVISDAQIQKYVRQVQSIQADMKEARRDEKNQEMLRSISENQQSSQEEILRSITESSENMVASLSKTNSTLLKGVTETMTDTLNTMDKRSNKTVWFIVCVVAIVFVVVCILVIVGIKVSAKAAERQSAQLDSTLKLIAGMQQTNNQLLLGGVTDLNGIQGLKSAGSSRWGVDALPAPEMTEDEKAELKQLVIDCEKLGSEIDAVTKRKNNSKNVSELVYKLAMRLGLNQNTSMVYFCAAMVYDAGFLSVPEELLDKEKLTEEERLSLQAHAKKFEKHLGFVPKKYWTIFEDAANSHHENMDGSGYPLGLSGDAIPQIARLIHVAESYNSLISRRTYKAIQDKESAIRELESKPELYDSDVVKVLDSIA